LSASLVNPFSETTSFVYDTLGRVGQKALANGTSEHYAYDTRSRLTQVQLKQGATVLRTTGYAWDNADQITSQTVNGVTTNYGYDLAGQLTSEVRSGYNVAYTYDANGNRLSKTVNGSVESYTYDLGDKMLTAGAKSYTYDAAGRTVGINAPSGTTTLTYDYESRVTAISGPGISETHTYNGLDTRVGTVQGGVSRTFVRDGSYVTDPVLRDGQATYTPGVSERRGGVSTWSHSGLKNADAQTSGAGAIQATRVYDAFGAELSATGTWKGPFGYAGGFGYQEDSSGLKLLGHRYYDPTTGRFLSRDPVKDGRNWYSYCANDPLASFDPDGLVKIILIWYPVFGGGYHAGIIVIDNARGGKDPVYSFAGGPTNDDPWNYGPLISRSGPWQKGTQDFNKTGGKATGGIVLVDDDSPVGPWLERFKKIEEEMEQTTDAEYAPVPEGPNTGNSNSWAREFLERAGLEDEYEKAVRKKGGAPWVPGWGKDVWDYIKA
jgi:RHS repeat-associated protein